MGIVHHASYIIWFEVGRVDYLRQIGGDYAELERQGYRLPVVELSVRYVSPARFGDTVMVRTRLDELKSRRMTFAYEAVDAHTGRLLATGTTVHVPINSQGQVCALPSTVRALLETHDEPDHSSPSAHDLRNDVG
jgi:acyl-CoA thioester hydrolase